MARYDKSPKNKNGKVERPLDPPKAEAEKTAGSPPSAADDKGAIHGRDPGPDPGENSLTGEMAPRHKSEVKDMLARHRAEHEQMIERHHGEIGKTTARHAKEHEPTSPNPAEDAATAKVKATAGSPPPLGKRQSENPDSKTDGVNPNNKHMVTSQSEDPDGKTDGVSTKKKVTI